MKEWWRNLNLRQQQLVVLITGFVAILLVYALLWAPISTALEHQRHQINANQSLLEWMQTYDAKLKKNEKAPPQQASSGSLVSLVQTELKQTDFSGKLSQLQEVGTDAVIVHWQSINFDKMIKWLIVFSNEHRLTITAFSVTPSPTNGIVDAQLRLEKK